MSSTIEDYLLLGSQVIDGKEQTWYYVIGGFRRFVKSWKVKEIQQTGGKLSGMVADEQVLSLFKPVLT